MAEDSIDQLVHDWQASGVREGDTLLVHSSIRRTLQRMSQAGWTMSPDDIVESFLRAVGRSGTLLLPLFNFDFTKGIPFDMRHTPSHMGLLTERARSWAGAVRTWHPLYSFAVLGQHAKAFGDLRNTSGYGHDSPFGLLHQMNGRIGILDLPDQESMTFYHFIEEQMQVPYRYHKEFTGPYIDVNGDESRKTFSLFVRDIEKGVVTHVNPMGDILWEKHAYTGSRPAEGCGLRTILTSDLFSEVSTVIQEGRAKGILYDFH